MSDGGFAAVFAVLGIGGLRMISIILSVLAQTIALVLRCVAQALFAPVCGGAAASSAPATTEVPPELAREIPIRILESTSSVERAVEKYADYMAWRTRFRVDDALRSPQPYFDVIEAHYPRAMHRATDRDGFVVIMEKPGRVRELLDAVRARAKALGRDDDAAEVVLSHQAFISEYLHQVVDTREHPLGKNVKIVDLSRASASDFLGLEVFGFLNEYAKAQKMASIERVHRVFIVNTPAGFAFAFNAIKPLISEKTLKHIVVCSSIEDARREIGKEIKLSKVPVAYGGTCDCKGRGGCFRGDANEETFRAFVRERNAQVE